MSQTHIQVALALRTPGLAEEIRQIVDSREGFAVLPPNGDLAGALLIYELGASSDRDLSRLSHLLESGSVAEVILTAKVPESDLLIRAMRSGIKEFVSQPVQAEEVGQALQRAAERISKTVQAKSAKRGRILSIMGAKGGIGTTTVAVNLAAALNAQKPGSVVLVDLRQPLGEVPFFLDLEYTVTWAEVVENLARLDATYLMSVLTKHPSGLYVLPAPSAMDTESEMTAVAANSLLDQLVKLFDFVVIDANCALDEASFKVMELSESVYLLTVLSLPCLANVKKFVDTMQNFNAPVEAKTQMVVNRHMSNAEISVEDAATVVGRKAAWLIPNDYAQSMSSINQGKTLLEVAPKGPLTKAFLTQAQELTKVGSGREDNKGSLLRRLFKKDAPAEG